jgi:hypothetical protein
MIASKSNGLQVMNTNYSSSDSDSSDDELLFSAASTLAQKKRRASKVDRSVDERAAWSRLNWEEHVEAKLRAKEWHTYYHMPVHVFSNLHSLLFTETEQEKEVSRRKGANSTRMGFIQTEVKLAATLRELFGEKRKSMVDIFHIAPTSARTAFLNVIRRINSCQELEGSVYATDQSPEVLAERAFAFQKRTTYPNIFRHCVGAIDGLFIKTQQPRLREVGNVRAYYSGHKKGFGLNMQATCDAQCRIIAFSCNTPGSTNDYVAFRHSFMYGHWPTLPSPYFYLGDCAYPLAPHCLTPFIGSAISVAQDAFNFYHSQLRITVERCFGIFVNVFGIFHAPLTFSIKVCVEVVEACVRLHNFRINSGVQHVARKVTSGATFRLEVNERSTDVFDVLDDERYLTDRPHMHDAAYEGYVRTAEQAGMLPDAAAAGASRRDVLSLALTLVGAQRPAANARVM